MSAEIELKVWLDDHEFVKERLSSIGEYVRSYEKTDTYWLPMRENAPYVSLPPSGLRIRRERSLDSNDVERKSVLITLKRREILDGIEVNDEREFSVSDADLFEGLICDLGLSKFACKEKCGWEWRVPAGVEGDRPISAEVSMVKDLGWFLEMELLSDTACEKTVEESRKGFFSLLEKLRISKDKIEAKPYTTLLQERRLEKLGGGGHTVTQGTAD